MNRFGDVSRVTIRHACTEALRETQEELKQCMRMHDLLASRSRKILRGQADLLCRALQRLKERSDAGQETAGQIWNSMIDGITAEIPSDFFCNHSNNYFWDSGEELTNDELAFRKLLEQAASKKNVNSEGKMSDKKDVGANNNKRFAVSMDMPSLKGGSLPESSSPHSKVKQCEEDLEEGHELTKEESDKLLHHLIDMLKVAAERTDVTFWDWKKEDDELKNEMQVFNKNLKVAMTLFTEIHNSPDVSSLIEAIEKFSADDAEAMFRMLNDVDPGSERSYEYSEEEGDDDEEESVEDGDEVFDSIGTEMDSDQEIVNLSKTKNEPNAKNEEYFKVVGAPNSSGFGEAISQKLDPADGEGYIIRHARSKKAGKPLKSKLYRNPACDHVGYTIPISHYRDWKRDGFRCMCGQKFRFLNAMDKHIFAHQEARMLSCDKCDYKVNRKCCMDKHKKDNHDKPKMLRACRRLYQCMFGCDGILKSKREMFDHQRKTERQCKHKNASKVPVRKLPPTPMAFVGVLLATCGRANITLTWDCIDAILSAGEKDFDRLKRAREDCEIITCRCKL